MLSDILWAEPAEFVAAGYDIKDVELYCAAVRFDFERVRQLLEDGAKPNVNLLPPGEQEYRNTLYSISIEEAHLSTEIDIWGKRPLKERDIRLLLALTAHSEMYDLLNKYCKEQQCIYRDYSVNTPSYRMLEDFVKQMTTLPKWQRDQKMEIIINLLASRPSHKDFQHQKLFEFYFETIFCCNEQTLSIKFKTAY